MNGEVDGLNLNESDGINQSNLEFPTCTSFDLRA